MKEKMPLWALIVLAVILGGCVTSVPVQVQRLPNLDTRGLQSISIEPFTVSDYSALQRIAANNLTTTATTNIHAMGHFNVIAYPEIARLRSVNENIGNHVDALFTGQVVSLTVNNSSSEQTRKDRDGNEIKYTVYEREVEMSFNYRLTRARDGSIIGIITKSDKRSDSNEEQVKLATPESMIDTIISRNMANLNRDLAPYSVTERRQLMRETSKDKVVKQRAKNAMSLTRSGNYRNAQEEFLGIYRDTNSFAAAYNTGILIEAQGDMNGAAVFFERIFSETSNPRASAEVARIRRTMSEADAVSGFRETQNQRDAVITLMINTIFAHLPNAARVALINNSESDRDLAEFITNSITAGLQSRNVTIVDRSNRALLDAERNYQLMGYVSDHELVSIGREAGVNTFVLISVYGIGSMRRLSVRMIDLERNTVIYQSPQTNEMNL
ncbi:MAG: hypothetical protein FWG89_07125 [Treponema sp.]|nr:hypothetical protein [Treponema sp.]